MTTPAPTTIVGRAGGWLLALGLAVAVELAAFAWLGRPVSVPEAAAARVACVSYAPYGPDETPFLESTMIAPAAIARDLALLAKTTSCVRTYSVGQGLDAVPGIAARLGLKVLLGAWIGRDARANAREVAGAVMLANAYPDTVRAVIVGNEVLLRGEMLENDLAALIASVRARVRVPVTYADVWEYWTKHPSIAGAVDFVTIHILPYWEDEPISVEHAVAHVGDIYAIMAGRFPGKTLLIGETGWPRAGRMREGARPGRVEQARFVRGVMALAQARGFDYNVIEAFDQPWKRHLEGTVGGHWGLYDAERRRQFEVAGPVRELPDWPRAFALAALLAVVVLIAAAGRSLSVPRWIALGLLAGAAASAATMQALHVLESSRTPAEWAASGGGIALAFGGAILWLGWIARSFAGERVPSPASVRAALAAVRRPWRARWDLGLALGAVQTAAAIGALAITLALLVDGRYRGFPWAAFAVPAGGALMMALLARLRDGGADATGAPNDDRREEAWLGVALAIGAVALAFKETLANHQALIWAAVSLALALPWLAGMAAQRRSRRKTASTTATEAAPAL